MEEITLDFNDKRMEMATKLVAKSSMFPDLGNGLEKVIYKELTSSSTLYEVRNTCESIKIKKALRESGKKNFLGKYAALFSNSF